MARAEDELAWFEASPRLSLDLAGRYLRRGEPGIDVGTGASRLVDALLDAGQGPVTVLDISGAALARSRRRLGSRADDVTWIEADVTAWRPAPAYALWHDRAVKVLFGMALRQTTGFVESPLRLTDLDWVVPDFGTLSRRQIEAGPWPQCRGLS